jgi:hypothetical protein
MPDRLTLLTRFSSTFRPFSLSFTPLASVKKRMPPKKAPSQEKKPLLGRPSNNLKIGIVGAFLLMTFYSPIHSFVIQQVSPTLGNHLSSMSYPRQVNIFL